jgi:hypothetical protein
VTAGAANGRGLAKRLLAQEGGNLSTQQDVLAAAVAVCRKLYLEIGQFVGTDGFKALLARSLHLARAEFSFLEVAQVGKCLDDEYLVGIDDAVSQREIAEVTEGIAAVLGGLFDLLCTFIGEDLALRMIHRRWPEVRSADGDERRG